ncbi:unnamed protein product [Polarella glacialis]|uniref:Uncharacterized protein n=1 Tax=Polarella glacialis TaxID=89957 RepID=A0A813EK41_POLGL|nr:unnamed protein product [Polarella glacialis]
MNAALRSSSFEVVKSEDASKDSDPEAWCLLPSPIWRKEPPLPRKTRTAARSPLKSGLPSMPPSEICLKQPLEFLAEASVSAAEPPPKEAAPSPLAEEPSLADAARWPKSDTSFSRFAMVPPTSGFAPRRPTYQTAHSSWLAWPSWVPLSSARLQRERHGEHALAGLLFSSCWLDPVEQGTVFLLLPFSLFLNT